MLHFLITGKSNCLLQKCLYISPFSKWKGRNAGVWGGMEGCRLPVAGFRRRMVTGFKGTGCRFRGIQAAD